MITDLLLHEDKNEDDSLDFTEFQNAFSNLYSELPHIDLPSPKYTHQEHFKHQEVENEKHNTDREDRKDENDDDSEEGKRCRWKKEFVSGPLERERKKSEVYSRFYSFTLYDNSILAWMRKRCENDDGWKVYSRNIHPDISDMLRGIESGWKGNLTIGNE